MPYKSYEKFIEFLRYLEAPERILYEIYEYFVKYVSYNYDELQVIKLDNDDGNLGTIKQNALNGDPTDDFKRELLRQLDEEFMRLEGRPVTPANRELFFRHYGTVVHHERRYSPLRKEWIPESDEIIKAINSNSDNNGRNSWPAEYYDEGGLLLKKAVCGEIAAWVNMICSTLGITSLEVRGKGMTGHAWNIIYIPSKGEWINFDMTMVKFYQDGWIKEHGEYKEEDWIFAGATKMFDMQQGREIMSIRCAKPIVFEPPISLANNNINEYEDALKNGISTFVMNPQYNIK